MCGIIGLLSKNNINILQYILNGLKQLQNRGYDSAGFSVSTNDSNFNTFKIASTEDQTSLIQIEKYISNNNIELLPNANIGIGHTRWATHGAKTDINSHPHISYDGKVILVHNGIIENYASLKKHLIKNNITFQSETDTEVISNLIAYYYNQPNVTFTEAIQTCLQQLEGTWGLVIINTETPDKLYCVRKGSPLLISENEDFVMISSEQSGFDGKVSNYFILEGNDLCEISYESGKINIKTDKKYKLKDTINENFDLSPYPYDHWTIKEIEEQYDASLRALSFGGRLLDENKVKLGGLEGHIEILKRIDNIIFLACGTSYNAALIGCSYFKELCCFNNVSISDGAEFSKIDIPKVGNTALIMLSQSGETKDLHRCIQIGKENNLFLIGIVNVVDSMIAREVDCGVYLNAGREVGVASTKCFTNQVIVLSLMSIWFSQIHDANINKRKEYISNLRQLPILIKKTIELSKNKVNKFINLVNKDNLFILGKGRSESIAKEAALKIKEISYIHAEGYSGSSLKHGPFALLSKDFPVILISPNNEHYSKMINVYEEIKSRMSPILFITDNADCNIENSMILPKSNVFGDLLSVIPLQLLAYKLSLVRNINPDFPRNLAKSVVVE
jgi:glutamine---fructose-6-phosphate transaminase (isomerizing)|uniref:glutamine--fructose-6-phosphate transaminase (isomerizing) n=1 Tax=viral metagenome TaxID=1070528 RepID=A0A6C0IT78_9ZZZZ